MEGKAKIINTSRGLSGEYNLLLTLEGVGIEEIKELEGIDLTLVLKKYVEKRGADSNSYFHVLARKIAHVVRRSETYVKNDLIAQAGFQEYLDDGRPAILKTNIEPHKMMEQEALHTSLCRVDVTDDGVVTYFYKIYRGSHTYNRQEFYRLLDLTIQQAQELDIETATPDQIERMQNLWEALQKRRERIHKEVEDEKARKHSDN